MNSQIFTRLPVRLEENKGFSFSLSFEQKICTQLHCIGMKSNDFANHGHQFLSLFAVVATIIQNTQLLFDVLDERD